MTKQPSGKHRQDKATSSTSFTISLQGTPSMRPSLYLRAEEICNIKVAHLNPALTKYNEKLELAKFDPEIRAVIDLMPQWRPIHVENLSQAAARAGKIRRDDLHTVADEFMRLIGRALDRSADARRHCNAGYRGFSHQLGPSLTAERAAGEERGS